jgi:hypothetical protein
MLPQCIRDLLRYEVDEGGTRRRRVCWDRSRLAPAVARHAGRTIGLVGRCADCFAQGLARAQVGAAPVSSGPVASREGLGMSLGVRLCRSRSSASR